MTRFAGIIGHPVAHSLSPAFQGAAFAHCGLDVKYERWDTHAEALAGRLVSLRDPKYLGANVTIDTPSHTSRTNLAPSSANKSPSVLLMPPHPPPMSESPK